MTVSTKPESRTVFFRPDGSAINHIDFASPAAMAEALTDAVAGAKQVGQVSYQPGKAIMVDTPTTTPGVVMRRTRSADMPAWAVQRKGDASATFSPTLLHPNVIIHIMNLTAAKANQKPSDMGWTITEDSKLNAPVLRVGVNGVTRAFNTDGTDVTDEVK